MKGSTRKSHKLQFSKLNDGYYGCVWGYTWFICSATPWLVNCKDIITVARVQATSSLLFFILFQFFRFQTLNFPIRQSQNKCTNSVGPLGRKWGVYIWRLYVFARISKDLNLWFCSGLCCCQLIIHYWLFSWLFSWLFTIDYSVDYSLLIIQLIIHYWLPFELYMWNNETHK